MGAEFKVGVRIIIDKVWIKYTRRVNNILIMENICSIVK